MVRTILKKMRSEFIEDKLKLESDQNKIKIKIRQNGKFLEKLREEEDQNQDLFSPRRKNVNLHDNILELEKEQDILIGESKDLEEQLLQLNVRITELDDALKALKESETELFREPFYTSMEENINGLMQKTEMCFRLLPADPMRCKLELSVLMKFLQEMKSGLLDEKNSQKGGIE